jgi:hypothetical protein
MALFSQRKEVRRELPKTNIHGRVAIAKPLITDNNAKMCKILCDDHLDF